MAVRGGFSQLMAKRPVSSGKARKILRDGSVKGRKLTRKQRGFFGAIAGGAPARRGGAAAARAHSTRRYA